MAHIFISYNDDVKDLAENLKGRFKAYNIDSWLFSRDRTLGANIWKEIEKEIRESHLVLILISDRTPQSNGQLKELMIAIEMKKKYFPIVTGTTTFDHIPDELKHINGLPVSAYNIESSALEIVRKFFPELLSRDKIDWKYPKPGDWLEVCNIDIYLERYFKLGDTVYFRRISPLGLFECYAPSSKGIFWFWPPNLKPADPNYLDEDREIEAERVPPEYQIMGMIEIERRGWEVSKKGK